MMKKFGLIGYPLSHSFSKKYFNSKFEKEKLTDHSYELFPLKKIENFNILIKNHPDLQGLNVTIPYKQKIISYLEECSPEAKAIGAVNTIKIKNNKLYGYNTDVYGFENSLKPLLQPHHKNALILGSGGAAQAVIFVLKELNILYKIISRSKEKGDFTYNETGSIDFENYNIIINTTPLGMSPEINACPNIPYERLNSNCLLYDLVYNPEETLFLKKGKQQGALTKNGLEMLYLQAEKAWEIWNDSL